ncbi:tetratricopeptide repeat protein [Streptomyces pseudoechinosporeus]
MNIQTRAEHATVLPPDAFVPMGELSAPEGLTKLPLHTPHFVGRGQALALLDTKLDGSGGVVVQAVHGLGGIGKSTLAAHWAATRADSHHPIWWITADTPAALDAGLAELATALQPALAGVLPAEALRERAVQWLAAHDGWLLILDNVSTPDDIRPLLARVRHGRCLITSRRTTGWQGLATPVAIDVLSHHDAVDLLLRVLDRTPHDLDGAGELCAELGGLPLAVEQASAYIAETGITPRAYLDLLTAHPAAMYRHGAEGTAPDRTIARIWRVTLDHLADDPLTGTILRTLAWYAPDHIPRSLLGDLAAPPDLTRAIGRLAAYSMLTVHSDTATLSVHRLVQALARTSDPDDPHRLPHHVDEARTQATRHLVDALPDHPDDPVEWPTYRTLLPHIDALTDHAPPSTDTRATGYLLGRAAAFLQNQGAVSRALNHRQRAFVTTRRIQGEDHPDTLTVRNNLAYAYASAGDLGRAIPLYERTLADRLRVLGEDHPDSLTSRNNLAYAYASVGDPERAIPLLKRTLADHLRMLGEDAPHTLVSRNNLAFAYVSAGDLEQAIPLCEQTVTHALRIVGEDHPHTLASRHSLAFAYASAGDLGRAIPLYEQTLADRLRVLGEDHPDTLASRNSLGYACVSAGDLGRAIRLFEEALADRLRVLGEDHPDTLTTRYNLAYAYLSAGDLGRAVRLFEQALADRLRVLGEDHPDTFAARQCLGSAYLAAEDPGRAVPLFEETLADQLRVRGEDHPDTLTIRRSLAVSYLSAGDPERATPLLEQVLAVTRRMQGQGHPDTLTSCDSLAYAYVVTGDVERAITVLEQTLADATQALGHDHPFTAAVRDKLTAIRAR